MMMAVMQIRRVRMRVPDRLVHVFVGVGLRALITTVRVPMMLVMDVTMTVGQGLVHMAVGMPLGEYQPRS